MNKILAGLALFAAVGLALAQTNQRRSHDEYQQHSRTTHTNYSHTYNQRKQHGYAQSRANQNHGMRSFSHTHSHYSGYQDLHHYEQHYGYNHFRHYNYGHRYTSAGLRRESWQHPRGAGHVRSWFMRRHWRNGPEYVVPAYRIYPGYRFSERPAEAVLCWILDNANGQYYEAYYYPQYGYYAWVHNPLVAVAVYNPDFSIVIGG